MNLEVRRGKGAEGWVLWVPKAEDQEQEEGADGWSPGSGEIFKLSNPHPSRLSVIGTASDTMRRESKCHVSRSLWTLLCGHGVMDLPLRACQYGPVNTDP